MPHKIVINPFTRISGFLEIQVVVEQNTITDARSSGVLYRGFETMLVGRPPLDAIYFTERICGICSTAHSYASTLALENALGVVPNPNGAMLRDFIHGCEFLQNHLRHFYLYTLPDFAANVSPSPMYRLPHNDYRLPAKVNERMLNHYYQGIKYSRMAHQMLAVLGGKAPHNHGIFVGGVTTMFDADKLVTLQSLLDKINSFIQTVMVEDVFTLAKYYPDYFENGRGYANLMSYGVFDKYTVPGLFYVSPGVFIDGELSSFDSALVTEGIRYAWYQADTNRQCPGGDQPEPDPTKEDAYTWVKAPRYNGHPLEVGPLARMYLSGRYRRGISTMDRTIARVLEAEKLAGIMRELLNYVEPGQVGQQVWEIPVRALGQGLTDTTRGALGHWISIEDQQIRHYDIITPTAWNLSPRDSNGQLGVIEQALVGTRLLDPEAPAEIGRIVRSFDPCVSCATHVVSDAFRPFTVRVV